MTLKNLLFQIPAIALAILVLVLCITPLQEMNVSLKMSDKLAHLLAFFPISFSILWGWGQANERVPGKPLMMTAVVLASLWGGLIELVQHYFIPTRQGDVFDFLADLAGAIIGLALYVGCRKTPLRKLM